MKINELYSDILAEDTKYEFKAILNPSEPLKWAKTIVAYANGEGGYIFVGVSDNRDAFGLSIEEIDKTKNLISLINERKKNSSAPVFEEGSALKYVKKGCKHYISVPQAKVSEDNEVFVYRMTVLNNKGKTVYEDWAFSQYFFAEKPDYITFDGFIKPGRGYSVKVCAEDVWGNRSDYLIIDF